VSKFVVDISHLSPGPIAKPEIRDGELIFRPKKTFILKNLLKEITPQNLHSEYSVGSESGKEILD
jgi:antitoxin component of MazEF toxin-antitoxin module